MGLVLQDKAAHHAISAKFPKKFDTRGKTLVVQYEVKLQGMCKFCGAILGRKKKKNADAAQRGWNAVVPTSSC